MFRRVTDYWRYNGFWMTLGRAAYVAAGKIICLNITRAFWIDLTETEPSAGHDRPGGLETRLLTPEEVDFLTTVDSASLADEFRERVRSGLDYCVAVLRDGEILGYGWYAMDSVEPEHNRGDSPASGVGISLPPGVAFLYNIYVRPEFRGQGALGQFLRGSPPILKSLGISKILGTTDWSNSQVRASVRKHGYVELGTVARAAIGPLGITRVSPAVPLVSGANFGKAAKISPRSPLASCSETSCTAPA